MSDEAEKRESAGGLSLQTLLISSLSAVLATVIVSQFWEQGTLFFTAMVPVAVALVSEALKRPAQKITAVAPVVTSARRAPGPSGTAVDPTADRVPEETRRTLPPEGEDPFGLYGPERRRGSIDTGRWLRVGLVTGVVAFFVAAAAVTASELALFGGSVGGGDRRTTYFGGEASRSGSEEREETTTTPGMTATPAPPSDAPPGESTPVPAPTPGATPAPSVTPPPTPAPTTTPPAAEPDPSAP